MSIYYDPYRRKLQGNVIPPEPVRDGVDIDPLPPPQFNPMPQMQMPEQQQQPGQLADDTAALSGGLMKMLTKPRPGVKGDAEMLGAAGKAQLPATTKGGLA